MSAKRPVAKQNKVCDRRLYPARLAIALADQGGAADWQEKRVGPWRGGGLAREASRPWSPPPWQPRRCPNLQLPWRAGVACFSTPSYGEGGGGAAEPAMCPPTRRGVHPCRCMYAHVTWRGTREWGRSNVPVLVLRTSCVERLESSQ